MNHQQTQSAHRGARSAPPHGSASGCTLKDPELMQCCCNCVHLRAVHYHCCTTPKPESAIGCVCGVQKGWACAMPEHDRIYDNWPQHSCGCELYTARTPNKKEKLIQEKKAEDKSKQEMIRCACCKESPATMFVETKTHHCVPLCSSCYKSWIFARRGLP